MSKLIDAELKKLIQKTQDIVKQMLPFLQEEVQSIISSRETSEHRIEHVLDRILDCLYSGFGEMEFKALNSYYATVNPQNAADYQRFYDEIMEDDPEQNNESTSDQAVSPVVPEIHYPEIWLDIEKESVKKTKEFMKALFQSNIPGSWHWFDKLDCSVSFARQPDPGMTLNKFIGNIRKNRFVRLQINRKEHPPADLFKTMNVIGFCVCTVKLADSPGIERFAWHCTPIEPGYFREHPNYNVTPTDHSPKKERKYRNLRVQ
jgi:hypothetical protein